MSFDTGRCRISALESAMFRTAIILFLLVGGSTVTALPAQEPAHGPLEVSIGELDGPEHATFGLIRSVDVDSDGYIYVADEQASSIRVFDSQGEYVTSAGRQGAGPGEFNTIRGMAVGPDDLLHVADAGNGRISTFERTLEDLEFRTSRRLDFQPDDVCVLGNRMYVLAQPLDPTGPMVREVDQEGRVLRGFGDPYRPRGDERERIGDWNHMRNWGFVTCDEGTGSVILLHQYAPIVRAFSADGQEAWTTELDEYLELEFLVTRGECCMYRTDPSLGVNHEGFAVTTDGAGHVFVGLQEAGPNRWDHRRFEARVLAVDSGDELGVQAPTGGLVTRVTQDRLYTWVRDPYPQVRVYSAR